MRRFYLPLLASLVCACTPSKEPTPTPPAEQAAASEETSTADDSGDPLLGFRYHGEPIHPVAVARMVPLDSPEPVAVGLDAQPWTSDAVELASNSVSFDDEEPGWDSYRIHDRVGSRFLLSVTQNGGGSGVFSTVLVVELRGDQLVPMFVVPTGDRCNGGLAGDPSFDGDDVVVPRWLTPYDLIDLSSRDIEGIEAYDELEASAMSCIGFARMLAQPGVDQTLLSVTFAPGLDGQWHGDQPGWTEDFALQPRFNQIYERWVAAGQTELDAAAIDRFVAELFGDQSGI